MAPGAGRSAGARAGARRSPRRRRPPARSGASERCRAVGGCGSSSMPQWQARDDDVRAASRGTHVVADVRRRREGGCRRGSALAAKLNGGMSEKPTKAIRSPSRRDDPRPRGSRPVEAGADADQPCTRARCARCRAVTTDPKSPMWLFARLTASMPPTRAHRPQPARRTAEVKRLGHRCAAGRDRALEVGEGEVGARAAPPDLEATASAARGRAWTSPGPSPRFTSPTASRVTGRMRIRNAGPVEPGTSRARRRQGPARSGVVTRVVNRPAASLRPSATTRHPCAVERSSATGVSGRAPDTVSPVSTPGARVAAAWTRSPAAHAGAAPATARTTPATPPRQTLAQTSACAM